MAMAMATPAMAETTEDKYRGANATPPNGWRLMLSDLSLLRINPIGLETRARFGLQKRLYPSETKVGKNNFGFVGVYPRFNPASATLGIGGELQPVALLNVKGFVEVQKYFGTFGLLPGFTSPAQNYSDQTIQDRADVPGTEAQAATIFHAGLAPLLQAKFAGGKIAARVLFQLDYWQLKLRDGETVAYDQTFDTLLPDGGLTLSTDTDVLYTGRPGLAIGLRHTWVKPIYKARHFADDDLSSQENAEVFARFGSSNAHQRLGVFAAYSFNDRGPSRFNKPTIIAIVSMYLDHRYRTGAPGALRPGERADDFTSRALPYLLVGFAFESDLLAAK
jgi:hypothetical protein